MSKELRALPDHQHGFDNHSHSDGPIYQFIVNEESVEWTLREAIDWMVLNVDEALFFTSPSKYGEIAKFRTRAAQFLIKNIEGAAKVSWARGLHLHQHSARYKEKEGAFFWLEDTSD